MRKPIATEGGRNQPSLNVALPLDECLAKTFKNEKGLKQAGRNVTDHCQIVGEVAKELILRMPQWLRDDLFPDGSALIAACHDLGKVSPTFQEKIYRGASATTNYKNNSKVELKEADPDLEKNWGGHAGVSQITAKRLKVGRYIPEILGREEWQQRRVELLIILKARLKCDFPKLKTPEQERVLSGLTSVADWIGSSSHFDNPQENWQELSLVDKSLNEAGFIKPKLRSNLKFTDIFKVDNKIYSTIFY